MAAHATRARWDAGRRELSYDLEQSPEQAGTQSLGGRRAAKAARQGGSVKLRKCAIFVDGGTGCTCGDYPGLFYGKACCKCDPPGSSNPAKSNPDGKCGVPNGGWPNPGCTCGDYHPAFHGKTCCKCETSGSSVPSTNNPEGVCGRPDTCVCDPICKNC